DEVRPAAAVEVSGRDRFHVGRGGRNAAKGRVGERPGTVVQVQPGGRVDVREDGVEVTVVIDVDQHDARRAVAVGGHVARGRVDEAAGPVVEVQAVRAGDAREHQIRIAVAVHVAEGRSGQVADGTRQMARRRVVESPPPVAEQQAGRPRLRGDDEVRIAVAVDVGGGELAADPRCPGEAGARRKREAAAAVVEQQQVLAGARAYE